MFQYNIKRQNGKEDSQVYKKCADVCRYVKESKKMPKIYDYPSVIVGCYTNYHRLYIDTSHSRPDYSSAPVLETALNDLGGIGKKRNECKNTIGYCAEPHAALITLQETKQSINKLRFTTAYRPRTGEKIKYCDNCKEIFNL